MARRPRSWWVSASMTPAGVGWHWKSYFRNPTRDCLRWGGPKWIQSDVSRARIEQMRAGDFVICYQARDGITGIAQLKSNGYKARGSGHYDMFDLRRSPSIWLENPVPLKVVRAIPRAADIFEFVRGTRGTVFSVEPGGFERILGLGIAFNPELSSQLVRVGL